MSEFSKSDLKEILSAVAEQNAEQLKDIIQELKKPTAIEQKKLDEDALALKAKNEERKDNSAGMIQKLESDRMAKSLCSHEHTETLPGMANTHCVHIKTSGVGSGFGNHQNSDYILCQKCQVKVRPEPAPETHRRGVVGGDGFVYDTQLWNRLFQKCNRSGDIFG